jgi:hypothetical protein
MKWNGTDAAGVKHAGNVRFIDKDHVEWLMVVTGPEGRSSLSCPPNKPAASSEDTPNRPVAVLGFKLLRGTY